MIFRVAKIHIIQEIAKTDLLKEPFPCRDEILPCTNPFITE